MPTPRELLDAGDLSAAVQSAIDGVKSSPTDAGKRWLLAELLVLSGDLERADKHFDFLSTQGDQPDLAAVLGRQLLRAETARREVFTSGRVPEFLGQPPEHAKLALQALVAVRDGKPEDAAKLLADADAARPELKGTRDGTAFVGFRDLDDLSAGVCEVFTSNGNYYWVPFETIETMEFRKPTRPKDLHWRSVKMSVAGGPDGEVYVPATYPGVHTMADEYKLGRTTSYADGPPVRGSGLREFLVGDASVTVLELESVAFELA